MVYYRVRQTEQFSSQTGTKNGNLTNYEIIHLIVRMFSSTVFALGPVVKSGIVPQSYSNSLLGVLIGLRVIGILYA